MVLKSDEYLRQYSKVMSIDEQRRDLCIYDQSVLDYTKDYMIITMSGNMNSLEKIIAVSGMCYDILYYLPKELINQNINII